MAPGKVHALPDQCCLLHLHHIHLTDLPTYLPQALAINFLIKELVVSQVTSEPMDNLLFP